jgi:hypothetical protein
VARIEELAGAAPTVQAEAASIDPAVKADPVIWTARLKIGRVPIFRASVSRVFRAAALIVAAVEADSVVIASAGAVVLAAAALAGSAAVVAADSEAGAKN